MNCSGSSRRFFLKYRSLLAFMVFPVGVAVAQDRFESPRVQEVGPAARAVCVRPVTATLGTFQPTPYIMVRGNWPAGGGYSPLETYGDQSMTLYGPLSPRGAVAARRPASCRGYDGRVNA